MSEQMKLFYQDAQMTRAAEDTIRVMRNTGVDMETAMSILEISAEERADMAVLVHERMAGKSA